MTFLRTHPLTGEGQTRYYIDGRRVTRDHYEHADRRCRMFGRTDTSFTKITGNIVKHYHSGTEETRT